MNLFCHLGVFWKKKGSENSRKEAEVADGTLAVILIQGRLTFTYEAERDLSSPEPIPWTAFAGPLTDIRVSPCAPCPLATAALHVFQVRVTFTQGRATQHFNSNTAWRCDTSDSICIKAKEFTLK